MPTNAIARGDDILPERLPSAAHETVKGVTVFDGLTPAGEATAGQVCVGRCLSPAAYPALHTRVPRRLYLLPQSLTTPPGAPHGLTVHRGQVIMCQGTDLYRVTGPGAAVRIGTVSDTDKRFVSLGKTLLVLPDKLLWDADTGMLTAVALATPTAEDVSIHSTYLQGGGINYELFGFRAGDCVYLEILNNWQASVLDGYYKIKSVYGEYINFCTHFPASGDFNIRLTRVMPDLDGACAIGDRMYGFADNTVYVCEAGNPMNWYAGDESTPENNPVCFRTGSDTPFTACIPWQGYPVLFKQDRICRVLGRSSGYTADTARASSMSLVDLPAPGVGQGMAATLCEVGGALYYDTGSGVYRYTGTYPVRIDRGLWDGMSGVCGGTDGRGYYLTMSDGASRRTAVYRPDIARGSWFEEDGVQAVFMTHTPLFVTGQGNACVLQRQDGSLWAFRSFGLPLAVGNLTDAQVGTPETAVAEFGDENACIPGGGRLKYVSLKAFGALGASMTVKYSRDGGLFETLDTLAGMGSTKLYRIPVHGGASGWYRLRLEMTGDWTVSGLWRETEAFSHA